MDLSNNGLPVSTEKVNAARMALTDGFDGKIMLMRYFPRRYHDKEDFHQVAAVCGLIAMSAEFLHFSLSPSFPATQGNISLL